MNGQMADIDTFARTTAAFALIFCSECSRPVSSPEAPVATVASTAASVSNAAPLSSAYSFSARTAGDASREEALAPGTHVTSLVGWPKCENPSGICGPDVEIAPGAAPGPGLPSGSIYLAEIWGEDRFIRELDVATGQSLQEMSLPLPEAYSEFRLQRAGGALHVLAWVWNEDIEYLRVSEDLQRCSKPVWLGGAVSANGPSAIASDGDLTIVAFSGVAGRRDDPKAGDGFVVASFDATGKRIAERVIPDDEGASYLVGNVAIAGGRPYVLARGPEGYLKLLRLNRKLEIEQTMTFRSLPWMGEGKRQDASDPELFSSGGGLYVRSYVSPEMVELSLSGREVRRLPSCRVPQDSGHLHESFGFGTWVGDIHLNLHDVGAFNTPHEMRLEWTDPGVVPRPEPPCPPGL